MKFGKYKILALILGLSMSFGFIACSQAEENTNDSSTEATEQAAPATETEGQEVQQQGPTAKNLNADQFEEMTKDSGVVILDVRTPQEYNSGHISGAVNMDYYSDFGSSINGLDKSKTYLIYCRSGGRSSGAMQQMKAAGFTTLYNLQGGMMGWQSQGKEVE